MSIEAPGARVATLILSGVAVDSSQLRLKVLPRSDKTASWTGMTTSGLTDWTYSTASEILHQGAETGTQRTFGWTGGWVKASPGLAKMPSIMTPIFSQGIWSATTAA